MAEIYLAFYKGDGSSFYDRMVDGAIRLFTKGKYSHVELAVKKNVTREDGTVETVYECYSSSPRDGGVRVKEINVDNPEQWHLCKLNCTDEEKIKAYYEKTKGKKYDLRGALGVVLGFRQKKNRYFCSEWCFNALEDSEDGWRFSPNHLEAVFRRASVMKADFILPLGSACRPAWHLKLNNLRYVSSPFDWMMSYRLETFIKFVKQKNLNGFFETNEYLNRDSGSNRVVRDTVNGIVSMHSFPVSMEIQDFYPSFIQIMSKRFDRLLRIFEQSETIVFLSQRKEDECREIKDFLRSFNELYPGKELVYINVEHSPEEKGYREAEEKLSDNIMIKHVYFNDVNINGATEDNPRNWLGNEECWTKLCSSLSLSNPQTILAMNEDKELR